MHVVLKMGALKLSLGGNQYKISQRIRSLVEIKRQFRREFAANSMRNSPRGNQSLGYRTSIGDFTSLNGQLDKFRLA